MKTLNRMASAGILLLTAAAVIAAPAGKPAPAIKDVSVSPAFFNPSIGQKETIRFTLARPGRVQVTILDRDGFPVCRLAPRRAGRGPISLTWDGLDSGRAVVPDEAYSIRIELNSSGGVEAYDPSKGFEAPADEPVASYSRVQGVLNYTLSKPSRVHLQAGNAVYDSATKEAKGPILKTVVDREPRAAGPISETWNGFAEGGATFLPDLPHFAVAVAAQALPENSIITVGNRAETFFHYALAHRPKGATAPRRLAGVSHAHHSGLNALEDKSPALTLTSDASFDPVRRHFRATTGSIELKLALDASRAPYFLSQDTKAYVFVDERVVRTVDHPESPSRVSIEAKDLPAGTHTIAVNWASAFGPVSVATMKIDVGGEKKIAQGTGR